MIPRNPQNDTGSRLSRTSGRATTRGNRIKACQQITDELDDMDKAIEESIQIQKDETEKRKQLQQKKKELRHQYKAIPASTTQTVFDRSVTTTHYPQPPIPHFHHLAPIPQPAYPAHPATTLWPAAAQPTTALAPYFFGDYEYPTTQATPQGFWSPNVEFVEGSSSGNGRVVGSNGDMVYEYPSNWGNGKHYS